MRSRVRCRAATPRWPTRSKSSSTRTPIAFDNVVPISQRLSLLELNEATCHWPVGDPSSPEFFFCGGKALTSLPYCAYHSRIALSAGRRPPPPPTEADKIDVLPRPALAGRGLG